MLLLRKTRLIAGLILALSCSAHARDGDLNPGFKTFGMMHFTPNPLALNAGTSLDLAILSDGKILLGLGVTDTFNNPLDFGVMRLTADGAVDPTFGESGGITRIPFDRPLSDKNDHFAAQVIQSDGKIVLGGTIAGEPNSSGNDMAVVRLTAQGMVDTGYGVSGKAIVPFDLQVGGELNDITYGLSLQPDGKLLVVGSAGTTKSHSTMAIARLTPDGIRDTGFDLDGRVTVDFGGDISVGSKAKVLADGNHILAVGYSNTAPNGTNFDFAIARMTMNGKLDSAFGANGNGKVTIPFDIAGSMADGALDFAELDNGRLLICGHVQVTSQSTDLACVRLLADGKLDQTYSPLLMPIDLGGNFSDTLVRMQRDAHGRVLLLARAENTPSGSYNFNLDTVILRLTPEGLPDLSFGKQGRVVVPSFPVILAPNIMNAAESIAVGPDGTIMAAATIFDSQAAVVQAQLISVIGDTLFADDFESH